MPPFVHYEHSVSETGHQQYLYLRAFQTDLRGQGDAVHFGYLEIRQQKMYLGVVISRQLKSFLAAAGPEDVVIPGQYRRHNFQKGCVIINDKHGLLVILQGKRLFHREPLSVLGKRVAGQRVTIGRSVEKNYLSIPYYLD